MLNHVMSGLGTAYKSASGFLEKTWFGKFTTDLTLSLKNGLGGFSSKKLIALHTMLLYSATEITWLESCYRRDQWDPLALGIVLASNVGLVAAAVGFNIQDKKNQADAANNNVNNPLANLEKKIADNV